jgi:hypothetical protein
MQTNVHADARPEAMGDVPGICELSLTRAIVQYRDVHEMDTPGGRIEDIGLALVVEGRYAATAEAIDLGSGQLKVLDLSTELVVLDWVYEPTLAHVSGLITATAGTPDRGVLQQYGFQLGLRVLERIGFGPLTRATFLRLGYRDICRDLDLHEGTSIRFVESDTQLEHALAEAFLTADLRRVEPLIEGASVEYHVRFSLPITLAEARACLAQMRRGLVAMLARFEPERFASLAPVMDTFGERETLRSLRINEPATQAVAVPPPFAGSHVIH